MTKNLRPDFVRSWAREFKSDGVKSFLGNGNLNLSSAQKEILVLNKALKESKIEMEILKIAGRIFSKGDNKYIGL